MSDLPEFLLARIADAEARYSADPSEYGYGHEFRLADCEAKRRLILSLSDKVILEELVDPELPAGYWAQDVVYRALALPYADHPDFREEWKP